MSEVSKRGFLPRLGAMIAETFGSDEPSSEGEPEKPKRGPAPVADISATALGSLRVRDVMVPRADIVGVEASASHEEVMQIFRSCKHSRLPVYRQALDDPVGFLHLKDLVLDPAWPETDGEVRLDPAQLRRSLFVPPSMSAAKLFRDMQARRVHIALVIDEFGGVDGLVTIEDLVEQIVGDIEDEHDPEEMQYWWKESDRVYRCRARAPIDEFEDCIGVRLRIESDESEMDTLGGLVVTLIGRVPLRGEVILHPAGHELVVLEADPRRVRMLRVTLNADDKTANGVAKEARS